MLCMDRRREKRQKGQRRAVKLLMSQDDGLDGCVVISIKVGPQLHLGELRRCSVEFVRDCYFPAEIFSDRWQMSWSSLHPSSDRSKLSPDQKL